jgi:hypothetical protein
MDVGKQASRETGKRNEIDRPTGQFRLRFAAEPCLGREEATPLGPHLRRVSGDEALASFLAF